MPKKAKGSSVAAKNLDAFLKTIQYAEGTYKSLNPYAVTFGYDHIILDFSDHPTITGEWTGKLLPDRICLGAGLRPGCKSTAAGAYQILKPTWITIKKAIPNLKFDQLGQDEGALYLINQKNATQYILSGAFEQAINKINRVWASLPGSPYGQPTRSMSALRKFYLEQGGQLQEV